MMRGHYLNGRILLRQAGGVRRYACEVAARLPNCHVVTPRHANQPWSARVWEQSSLARQTADGVLLSPAASGPLFHPRHVVVVHDLFSLVGDRSLRPSFTTLNRWQVPQLISRARAVVAVSPVVADEIISRFDVAPRAVEVVAPGASDIFANGSRCRARELLGLDPARPVVAALLDPSPRKRSATVAELLVSLEATQPHIQVVAAGRRHPPSFARPANPNSARARLQTDLGPVDDTTLAALYRAADVFVALSEQEGFGLPVIEAAISGAAVVTTAIPAVAIDPECFAVVTDADDAFRQIIELLNAPQARQEMADRAATSLGDLRWDRTAATLEGIMNQVGGM